MGKGPQPPPCDHWGQGVHVGPYEICAGGTRYLTPDDLDGYDLLVPLTNGAPWKFGVRYNVLGAALVDFGGVPPGWRNFLDEVVDELDQGQRILTFCVGSHGRTGCFLASLIALLESREETPDPIAAVRERHCSHAVETLAQAEAIFAIRGEALPRIYVEEFTPPAIKPQTKKGKKK